MEANNVFAGQPYVTELDLRHSLIPEELIADLVSSMPKHTGPDLVEDRNLMKYDYVGFMDRMLGSNSDAQPASPGLVNGYKELNGSGSGNSNGRVNGH